MSWTDGNILNIFLHDVSRKDFGIESRLPIGSCVSKTTVPTGEQNSSTGQCLPARWTVPFWIASSDSRESAPRILSVSDLLRSVPEVVDLLSQCPATSGPCGGPDRTTLKTANLRSTATDPRSARTVRRASAAGGGVSAHEPAGM